MWVLPSAYVLALQAAGDANDLPGAFFVLAAVALALRAVSQNSRADLLWSMLAMALATGLKASNAPLALTWAIAAWPARRLLLQKPLATAATAALSLICSFFPSAVMNFRHCGDWSGARLETAGQPQPSPWICVSSDALRLAVQNANPPVFPWASAWNAAAAHWLPAGYQAELVRSVEAPNSVLSTVELPLEDNGGTGPFWLLLVAGTGLAGWRSSGAPRSHSQLSEERRLRLLRWSPWLALAVFVLKMSLAGASRLSAPYDLLLPLPFLAGAGAARATRSAWWRGLSGLQMASALLVLIVTPARPLFPALTLMAHLPESLQSSPTVVRARKVFSVFRSRPDCLAPVRALLPAGTPLAALSVNIEPEASLWRPYGTRRFEHVIAGDSAAKLRAERFEYLVICTASPLPGAPPLLPEWMAGFPLEIIGQTSVTVLAGEPPETWVVARLKPETAPLPH